VVLLVAAAVLTTITAAIVLARGAGQPDTPIGAAPPATTSPDAEGLPAGPVAPPESSQPPSASASASPTTSTAAPTSPGRATPLDQITGLAAVLQRQVDTGQLKRKAGRTLLRDLDEVARHVNAGDTAEAADSFTEFRHRVTELRSNGELTGPLPDLDSIANAIAAG
jgi:hypothetical protein